MAISRVALEDLAAEFGPSELQGHFVLGRSLPMLPEGWEVQRLEGWLLAAAPQLPVVKLVDTSGAQAGWVVGHPIDVRGRRIVAGGSEALTVPVGVSDSRFEERFDDWLFGFGGRYAAVVVHPRPRVVQDACGIFAVLYSAELEAVASSLFLLPDRDGRLRESDLVAILDVHTTSRDYPFGTTPVAHARQLFANHALDLRTWEVSRCWPRGALDEQEVTTLAEAVAEICEAMVVAAVRVGRPRMGLTAGGDTRVMLACARPVADEIDFFTLSYEDGLGATDLRWAPVLADRFGLQHRVVPWRPPTDRDVRLWLYHTSSMTGEPRGRFAGPTKRSLGGSGPFLAGTNGAMLHGDYWQGAYRDPRAMEPERLIDRGLHCPLDPRFVAFTERWLEQLPPVGTVNALALWYLEMSDGPWASFLSAAFPDVRPLNVYPLTHRVVVEACLRTSPADRMADRLRRETIAARWPELMEIPFNQPSTRVAIERTVTYVHRKARAGARKAVRRARGLVPGFGLTTPLAVHASSLLAQAPAGL
jgi:hypothetical protein